MVVDRDHLNALQPPTQSRVLCITIIAALCSSGCGRVVHPRLRLLTIITGLFTDTSYAKQVGEMVISTPHWGCYCGDNDIVVREEQTVTKSLKKKNYRPELVKLHDDLAKRPFCISPFMMVSF